MKSYKGIETLEAHGFEARHASSGGDMQSRIATDNDWMTEPTISASLVLLVSTVDIMPSNDWHSCSLRCVLMTGQFGVPHPVVFS